MYDEHFNLASTLSQFPQNGQAGWANNQRRVFTSDPLGNIKTEESQSWLAHKNEWEGKSHRTFYYEAFGNTEAVQRLAPSTVSVALSPSDGLLQVSIDKDAFPGTEFQGCILSPAGKPLHPLKVASAGHSFNISLKNLNIPNGTYLLEIRQGKLMVTKMIVILN